MATAIIGSTNMDLEQTYRLMTLELAVKLSPEDCKTIADVAACSGEVVPLSFHIFHTLESRGTIGPLKLEFLEEILVGIGRDDLLDIIAKYKKNPVYRDSKKKPKKKIKKQSEASSTDCSQYAEMYALFLTQFAQFTLSMRSALDSNDVKKMKAVFSSVANDAGDAVRRTLSRSMHSTVGIMDDRSISGESSDSLLRERSSSPYQSSSNSPSPTRAPLQESGRQTESEVTDLLQLPCQASSPSFSTAEQKFIYCDSHTGGSGDSGVGDIHHHIPSDEALRQLDPDINERSDQDSLDDHQVKELVKDGYMQLTFQEPRPSDNYATITFEVGNGDKQTKPSVSE